MQDRMDELENVFRMRSQPARKASNDPSAIDRSGQAIVGMLQQAAEAAQRNEERLRLQAQQLTEELRGAEAHVEHLQAELARMNQRAVQAEDWLLRIYKEVKEGLVDPLTRTHEGDEPEGRAAHR